MKTKLSVIYSVIHKRVFTPLRDIWARIKDIEEVDHFFKHNNDILIYKKKQQTNKQTNKQNKTKQKNRAFS